MSIRPDTIRDHFMQWLRPVSEEDAYEITEVIGEIPRALRGTLYRNGPSQRQLPPEGAEAMHLFGGDGYVQAIRFEDGRARFQSSFVRTQSFLAEQEEGRFCMPGLQLGCEDPIEEQRVMPNTSIVYHAGRLFALVENASPFELDPETLEPMGHWDYDGRMIGMSTTAHPKIDGRTGQMLIHGYQPVEPYVGVYAVEPDGRVSMAEALEAPWPSMMHDFGLSEHHMILPLCPVYFDAQALAEGKGFDEAVGWRDDLPLKFGIRGREPGSPVQWFEAPTPGYIFHPGNAYEEDGVIYMDACTYLDGKGLLSDLSTIRSGRLTGGLQAVPFLYEFDLATGECRNRQLSDRKVEFPRIDDRLVGFKNRWGYCAADREGAVSLIDGTFTSILKYDRMGGSTVSHDLPEAHWGGEPVFAALGDDAAEDEGVVLSLVYDGPNDRSWIYILDAQHIDSEPLARLGLRQRVPLGFHGNFVPGVV